MPDVTNSGGMLVVEAGGPFGTEEMHFAKYDSDVSEELAGQMVALYMRTTPELNEAVATDMVRHWWSHASEIASSGGCAGDTRVCLFWGCAWTMTLENDGEYGSGQVFGKS